MCLPDTVGSLDVSVDVGGESQGILAAVSADPAKASAAAPSADVAGEYAHLQLSSVGDLLSFAFFCTRICICDRRNNLPLNCEPPSSLLRPPSLFPLDAFIPLNHHYQQNKQRPPSTRTVPLCRDCTCLPPPTMPSPLRVSTALGCRPPSGRQSVPST